MTEKAARSYVPRKVQRKTTFTGRAASPPVEPLALRVAKLERSYAALNDLCIQQQRDINALMVVGRPGNDANDHGRLVGVPDDDDDTVSVHDDVEEPPQRQRICRQCNRPKSITRFGKCTQLLKNGQTRTYHRKICHACRGQAQKKSGNKH